MKTIKLNKAEAEGLSRLLEQRIKRLSYFNTLTFGIPLVQSTKEEYEDWKKLREQRISYIANYRKILTKLDK